MSDRTGGAERWGADPFVFTEAARGGPWVWRVGAEQFEGEPLGPVRHAHDDAAEYYYMFSGAAHVETGGEELVLEEGQLGYIPPDAPHNFLGPAGDRDACLFCVIAPNLVDNKWRVGDWLPGSDSLRMAVATPFEDDSLPGDAKLSVTAVELGPGDGQVELVPEGFESFYVVLDGALEIELAGGLHGTIEPGTFLHLREGMRHRLSASRPSRALRFDCAFAAWQGTATAEDAAA
jgi:mannose-6-phosphate isomerase-like protein (cupin superfamily)